MTPVPKEAKKRPMFCASRLPEERSETTAVPITEPLTVRGTFQVNLKR